MPSKQDVHFTVGGLTIAGVLHKPDRSDDTPQPTVLIVGPSPQVKEQVPNTYATRVADAGYLALTIDFRNFGESGGS